MEKVYHEMDTKPIANELIRTYIEVQAWRPVGAKESELPAVIILAQGSISIADRSPTTTEYTAMPWDHKASDVIREAIRLFDLLRVEVWEQADKE